MIDFPMNKIFFFSFLSLLFFSCSRKSENNSRSSRGKINTISVVIDDPLWNGIIGDSIRNKFASPVEGLSKEEPLFDINQYPINVMEGFVTKSRTIIVIKLGSQNNFAIHKNQYATPQNVIHITGKSLSDLLNIIEKRTPQIINSIQKGEIKAHQLLLNNFLIDMKPIQNQFHISIKIPNAYSYELKNENFIWLKKEFPTGCNNLLITQLPISYIKKSNDVLVKAIHIHDSIGSLYIKGKRINSSQYIDKTYPLYISKIT